MNSNTKQPENPLAFPSHGTMGEVAHEGMLLRDYFVAHSKISWEAVIETIKINKGIEKPTIEQVAEMMAEIRFLEADALLIERSK